MGLYLHLDLGCNLTPCPSRTPLSHLHPSPSPLHVDPAPPPHAPGEHLPGATGRAPAPAPALVHPVPAPEPPEIQLGLLRAPPRPGDAHPANGSAGGG